MKGLHGNPLREGSEGRKDLLSSPTCPTPEPGGLEAAVIRIFVALGALSLTGMWAVAF